MMLEEWAGPNGDLGRYIAKQSANTLDSYRAQENRVEEDARLEQDTAKGGYQHRQLYELIQNSADALWHPEDAKNGDGAAIASGPGRIEVQLTEGYLYCADDGNPISSDGVKALMFSRMSTKRGSDQIGTFGLGFKAVLGVSDSPEFYSRSGSFRFDRKRALDRIREVVPNVSLCPVLRLPEPIDPIECSEQDGVLCDLMEWAVNIVRLPLIPGGHDDLRQQMLDFPSEFVLFVPHVGRLTISDGSEEVNLMLQLERVGSDFVICSGAESVRWKVFQCSPQLSEDARNDRRPGDDRDAVPIWWAVPADRLDRSQQEFWAYFPTSTTSLVPGILNAPWKTNEDRQNLLPGPYNDELIEAAAEMIANALPELATQDDPARHLGALPRSSKGGDNQHASLLRSSLFSILHDREIVPDQDGKLQLATALRYPPQSLTKEVRECRPALDYWASLSHRPVDWLHHSALTRERLAKIDRLHHPEGEDNWVYKAQRSNLAEWLEALTSYVDLDDLQDLIVASKAALLTLALIPENLRTDQEIGNIILTEAGELESPTICHLVLPEDGSETYEYDDYLIVHSELTKDRAILSLLKSLGIARPSPEWRLQVLADEILLGDNGATIDEDSIESFWKKSRNVKISTALDIIQEYDCWKNLIRVRTLAGDWMPLFSLLMPSPIVLRDGSRDQASTVDMEFHLKDQELISALGVRDSPAENCNFPMDISSLRPTRDSKESDESEWLLEDHFLEYVELQEQIYRNRGDLRSTPAPGYVAMYDDMKAGKRVGPLDVLLDLSEEGAMLFTDALLNLDDCFDPWLMGHTGSNRKTYPVAECEPFPIFLLRKYGRVQTPEGIVPLVEALGSPPKNSAALEALLSHPKAEEIKKVLHLGEKSPATEVFGVVRQELTDAEAEACRAEVRECRNDADRLLAAVGEEGLRALLPESLLEAIEDQDGSLTGVAVADAAISIYHTDALRQFKDDLYHLNPPRRWAGSAGALAFVHSLGFSDEWAGVKGRRRPPFEEVDGPRTLPELHDYQRTVADNLREMLRSGRSGSSGNRGMISMPTGSGKTRVAVQAVVEAMRDEDFCGGILWVADRDELCEQAVQAWEQVWRSEGTEASRLRISRLWESQKRPVPATDRHVIVASIQTLRSRLFGQASDYGFLQDFKLVVCDEAHKSTASSFTNVLAELGLSYRRHEDVPCLLGLTATPYRGYDEDETRRLARRYGENRLDWGAFSSDDPQEIISELQRSEVLARADHELIDGGTFKLNESDRKEIRKFQPEQGGSLKGWLPQSVENRIARSTERTRRIIEAYDEHIEADWPTLIFATSVEHAQTLSALLNRKGISARAVSGETEPATRRGVVEKFRSGEIKALVNYAVFREGFDAPKTRAIIVARPVYSPNLYFQMIGRGLRGPMNGGDERCLILNVRDNIEGFGEELAFSELEWLWDK